MAALFLGLPSAQATESGDPAALAEAANQRGLQAYSEGRYPEAVEAMLEAYQHFPDPGLLFNVARIYEAMSRMELAKSTYERFVQDPAADPETVRRALEALEAIRGEPEAVGGTRELPAAPPEEPPEAPPPALAPPPAQPQEVVRTSPAPFVLVGAGAATVGAGVTLAVLARQSSERAMDLTSAYPERTSAVVLGRSQAISADVLGITGASLAIAGLVVGITQGLNRRGAPVSVAPWFTPGGGGLSLAFGPRADDAGQDRLHAPPRSTHALHGPPSAHRLYTRPVEQRQR